MKRLRHILLNVVTILSQVLCLGTAVMWVRGYHVHEEVYFQTQYFTSPGGFYGHCLGSLNGGIYYTRGDQVWDQATWSWEPSPKFRRIYGYKRQWPMSIHQYGLPTPPP